jgi:adenylate kinase
VRVVLVGPPGAGKGTQAQFLASAFAVPKISTGDIFRTNVSEGTTLGLEARKFMDAGDLVPDEVTIGMVRERLAEGDAQEGFLLDGFPRTVSQAEALDAALQRLGRGLSAALLIDVPDENVLKRISGRRVCRKEGHVYHVESNPPKHEGVCDIDGSKLFQRDDDKPETVEQRLHVYHEQTEPIVEHYQEQGLLRRFDGTRPPTEVHDHLRATIATLRLEESI